MRCAWREVAALIDPWYLPAIFFSWIVMAAWVYAGFAVARQATGKTAEKPWWDPSGAVTLNTLTTDDVSKGNQLLRDTGRGWMITIRRALIAIAIVIAPWPFISPTYCENVVCKGYSGKLKPRTECLPQSACTHTPAEAAPLAR
jgi:hypothetical protein